MNIPTKQLIQAVDIICEPLMHIWNPYEHSNKTIDTSRGHHMWTTNAYLEPLWTFQQNNWYKPWTSYVNLMNIPTKQCISGISGTLMNIPTKQLIQAVDIICEPLMHIWNPYEHSNKTIDTSRGHHMWTTNAYLEPLWTFQQNNWYKPWTSYVNH